MKTSTVRGVRSAVAAGGVAMLMFVAGCGGSDEAADGNGDEPAAEADANGEEAAAEDDSAAEEEPVEDDSAAEEEPVEDDSAAEEEPAGDDGGSGAVAPAEDFDPCTVVDAAAVSGAVGFDVEDGESDELMGGLNCTFLGAGGDPSSVLVQWIPVDTDLDTMIESVESTYQNMSDVEELDLPGSSDARGFSAEVMSQPASVVFAKVDGGMFQVMVLASDGSTDIAAVQSLTELTLSSV